MPGGALGSDSIAAFSEYNGTGRLVKHNGAVVQTIQFDGLNRRIVRDDSETRHFYYNEKWQVVESLVDGTETADCIYSYHAGYVDAVAVRMRASDEHIYLQDGNFNVTALADPIPATVALSSGMLIPLMER